MARLDHDAAARVIRRAIEIEHQNEQPMPNEGFDPDAIVSAAAEVGIDPDAVRWALAEEQLRPAVSVRRTDWLAGPETVSIARLVPADHAGSLMLVEQWLGKGFVRQRRDGHQTEWRRRPDFVANVMRWITTAVGGVTIDSVDRVNVGVVPVDDQSCMVRLTADRRWRRRTATVGSLALGATAVIGLVAGAIAAPIVGAGALITAGAVMAGCSVAGVAVSISARREAAAIDASFERLLDVVAAGDRPSALGRPRSEPAASWLPPKLAQYWPPPSQHRSHRVR